MTRSARRDTLLRLFGAPAALAAATGIGLVAGLLGDGIWDALSWIGLGLPLAAIGWHLAASGRAAD